MPDNDLLTKSRLLPGELKLFKHMDKFEKRVIAKLNKIIRDLKTLPANRTLKL